MAGSITVTTSRCDDGATKYSVAWLSDASGVVSANSFAVKTGELLQVVFTPNGGGTQPTDLYDMTMPDAAGIDVLSGGGANLSNSVAASIVPAVSTYFPRRLTGGNLTPTIANAGNAKGGTVDLYVR